MMRSNSLDRFALDDSIEVYFVFFWASFCFLQIFEVYTKFLEYNENKKSKNPPHSAGPASAHGSSIVGLAHGHFGLAGLATWRGRGTRSAGATSTTIAVARSGWAHRRLPGNEVGSVSTTARWLHIEQGHVDGSSPKRRVDGEEGGGAEPPVAGDEVPTVLQLEEGKGNVRRGSSERQRRRRQSSLGGRVGGSAVAKFGRLEGAPVSWSG
jgi:hypothetical protein